MGGEIYFLSILKNSDIFFNLSSSVVLWREHSLEVRVLDGC